MRDGCSWSKLVSIQFQKGVLWFGRQFRSHSMLRHSLEHSLQNFGASKGIEIVPNCFHSTPLNPNMIVLKLIQIARELLALFSFLLAVKTNATEFSECIRNSFLPETIIRLNFCFSIVKPRGNLRTAFEYFKLPSGVFNSVLWKFCYRYTRVLDKNCFLVNVRKVQSFKFLKPWRQFLQKMHKFIANQLSCRHE